MLVHVTVCISSVATSPPFILHHPSPNQHQVPCLILETPSVTTPTCPLSSPGTTALLPHTSQVGYNHFIES
ncbi:hypothetical protein PAXRUDRAFT_834203 [Paxillus rubicundulus Ve08.2h10]|uniref:Uncharacterized protein n=1 Tax=Paxillus rubicundulus Ve08.2h10 TaxID=930991 RepID=A0A0D0DEC8_9AGAM|nr:hypothetical protein PAXRUDRAFT_834203 [Paxillus rubicundulus Ve08.2h10]